MQTPGYTLKRAKDARAQFGIANSTLYAWIENGLMVPGVQLGIRSVAFPSHELDALAAARIRGASEDEIRVLVRDLVAARALAGKLVAGGEQ